ncbi:MAG: hypothetical protein LC800_00220 [Acidobacteria bacterium]|nr:hypothetical protein [Acidobacteriota bacterium]
MKKSLQERLNASLDKALDPPRKPPKQELDALLDEYDDGQALGAQRDAILESSNGIPSGIPEGIPSTSPEGIPTGIPTANPEDNKEESAAANKKPRRPIAVRPQEEAEEPSTEVFISVDATHTASEKIIYSHMYRETVSKGRHEGHFGPALLMKLSGIRSRNTVHKALYGLIEKLSVEKVAESLGNPFGPRYRVYGPQEILRRRKGAGMLIDPQTKRIMERDSIPTGIPSGIPEGIPPAITKNWDTPLPNSGIAGIPNSGILLNTVNTTDVDPSAGGSSSNRLVRNDDEAFAGFVELMSKTAEEIVGHTPSRAERERWLELAEVLSAELKIAAGRTTVSSAPAFLAEHLRRRLWKKDKRQIEAEAAQPKSADAPKVDSSRCPDCFGTGMWYPEGFEKGVARCEHKSIGKQDA